jgi:TRAP-type C4-dicarboxylate transport system substrate-binding protein
MNRRESLAVIAAGALISSLAGCQSDDPEPIPSKDTAPVTLRLATYDEQTATGGILIDHFVQTVHELDPTVTVEPVFQAAPDEQSTIELIQAGDAELGLVATRAWDLVGVDSMRAINTPFLIDSTELLDEVVAGDQAAVMMKGLSAAGMTGLAMLPESLRHPFGTEAAPLGADDYEGATIRSPHSTTTWDVLGALGADPMFEDAGYTIAESQYDQAPGPEGAGNVTLFAKADVIVISDSGRPKVSDSQLDALTEAAETTRDWAIGTFADDAAAAAGFCDNGGTIVAASPAEIASLESAVATVVADLKKDDATAGVIAAIEELKAGITVPAAVTACPEAQAPSQASALDGTYRWEVTKQALIDAGVDIPEALDDVPGIHTAIMADGGMSITHEFTEGPKKGDRDEWHATYEFDGVTFTIHWSQSETNCTSAKVKILDDGDLEFSDIVECAEDEFGLILDQVGMRRWDKIK